MLRMGRSVRPRVAVAFIAAIALVGTATVATATLAQATPQSDLQSQQQRASELEAQIEANGNRVSVLDEQYTNAQLAIQNATNQINADEAQLAAKARETDAVRGQLEARAAELYMGAGNPDPLAALDVSDTRQLGSRSAYAGAAADSDRRLLDEVKVAVEQLGIQQKSLKQAREAAVNESAKLDASRKQITEATAEQESLLSQVKGNIKTLVDQIQAEQQREQEAAARAAMEREARAQAEALAAQQAQAAQAEQSSGGNQSTFITSSGGGGGSSGDSGGSDGSAPAQSPEAQVAVNTAKAQLGKPYVYAGSGPSVFDCSGLTMYAWAAAGVGMPHNAEAQYESLPHVSMDQLEPGDLVFFGSPIHHVGIFVGGGTMIEAPYTGVDVRYHSIYRPDFAGAARP
jgi:peptidoglycan DL-endopeptidase CwlO